MTARAETAVFRAKVAIQEGTGRPFPLTPEQFEELGRAFDREMAAVVRDADRLRETDYFAAVR